MARSTSNGCAGGQWFSLSGIVVVALLLPLATTSHVLSGRRPPACTIGICLENGITSIDSTITRLVFDPATSFIPQTISATARSSTSTSPTITPTNPSESKNVSGEASGDHNTLSIPIIVGIAVGGTVFLAMCVCLWYLAACLRKRKRRDRDQKDASSKAFDAGSMDGQSTRGIPLGAASKKELGKGNPWIDEENNNNSTAYLYTPSMANNKPHLPPTQTRFASPQPRGRPEDKLSGEVSPVSPVSPRSVGAFDNRVNKGMSTVSSIKGDDRTHHNFYNFASPPLPTPAPGSVTFNHMSRNKPSVLAPGRPPRPESEYPPESVSPLSRNPSGKSVGASDISNLGEEQISWQAYRDMIRKYQEHDAQGVPIPKEVIQRLSGLSQFNFGFDSNSPVDGGDRKRESSYYGWAPEKSSHFGVSTKDPKYLSGSSSIYSQQPMTPPPPIGHGHPGPSTPDMFFGRPPPSYTSPSPQPARTKGQSYSTVSQPSFHSKPEPRTGGLARANSLRWRREVEEATDLALKKIGTEDESRQKRLPKWPSTAADPKSSGLWTLLTPKIGGNSPRIGTVPSGSGSLHTASERRVGKSGVVII